MAIFKRNKELRNMAQLKNQFDMITGYQAHFTNFNEGIYEMDLVRSAIETKANHVSKLNPVLIKSKKPAHKKIERILQTSPNPIMTTQQFLSRLMTMLEVDNNVFIIPLYKNNDTLDEIIGIYPVRSVGCSLISENGTYWLKYKIEKNYYIIEYERVGHLRKHYFKQEFFGDNNKALDTIVQLINTQNEGISEGVKQSANIRFLARLAQILNPNDIEKERKRLADDNLSVKNTGGVMIFDNRYAEVQSIDNKPFIINDKQVEHIKSNVFNYFHVSEAIIQNRAKEDEYNAFYEGSIEPFSIQVGQVLSKMFFTDEEIRRGYGIHLESMKLQFASNNTKLSVSQQLFDRGILTTNQVNDIWNLPHVEGGDKRYIRKDYTEVTNLDKEITDDGKGDGNSIEEPQDGNGEGEENQIE